jgi:hypothetical protein
MICIWQSGRMFMYHWCMFRGIVTADFRDREQGFQTIVSTDADQHLAMKVGSKSRLRPIHGTGTMEAKNAAIHRVSAFKLQAIPRVSVRQ